MSGTNRCLGRLPARPEQMKSVLRMARYTTTQIPTPPASVDWIAKLKGPNFGMMRNDELGDCTAAGIAHLIQILTGNLGTEFTVLDSDVVDFYSAISGYDKITGENDNGAVVQDALNRYRKVGLSNHKALAYIYVNPQDVLEVKQALALFGNLYLGVDLPAASQRQKVFTVPARHHRFNQHEWMPGTWGGHCYTLGAYNDFGPDGISWGARQKSSWDWFTTYCKESYVVLSADWFDGTKKAPNGFDFTALSNDLRAMGVPV